MPFINRDDFERLQSDNERLAAELEVYEDMRPHLNLAMAIKEEIIELLDRPELTTREIGELAYRSVLKNTLEQARDEIVAEYEQKHRKHLYERVVEDIKETEGEELSKKAKQRVETDPELALELHSSARRELAARALEVVRGEITDEQSEIISQEAERQLALDRLDVELVLEGELDLHRDDITHLLRHGDKLVLSLIDSQKRDRTITLVWTKDVRGSYGWVYRDGNVSLIDRYGYKSKIPNDVFVYPASVCPDFSAGKSVVTGNLLTVGQPFELINYTTSEPLGLYNERSISRNCTLKGTDFQTKDLFFNEADDEANAQSAVNFDDLSLIGIDTILRDIIERPNHL